ncbi:MAG: hypothetical protein B7Y80_09570 [Hyphomicrobium sp. 32-62-53]|nr:MAG: hypothetical protein B7Z29_09145 [Hyphomicrobium sp. 12-62-95]OYX99826.1 MAG: hypothetical protein B7Y80_09570 [Hyphomicrobium sp. 32-62-53]
MELDRDGQNPMLMIATGRAKNRNAHRVPLSPQVEKLVRGALAASGASAYVFPGAQDTHISPRSVSKAMERTRDRIELGDVTIHDLRRTVGTHMSRRDVPRDVRERILNHGGKRKGNVTDSVYNRYEYDAEKRAALELWAGALDGITSGSRTEIDSYAVRLARLKGADKITVG